MKTEVKNVQDVAHSVQKSKLIFDNKLPRTYNGAPMIITLQKQKCFVGAIIHILSQYQTKPLFLGQLDYVHKTHSVPKVHRLTKNSRL